MVRHRSPIFLEPYYQWRRASFGPLRIAANALVFAWFWLWIPGRARKAAGKWEKDENWVRWVIPIARQWMTDPFDFAIFNIDDETDLLVTQRRMEQVGVIRVIESADTDHSPAMLDKLEFQIRCEDNGLRVPPLHAVIRDGVVERRQAPSPQRALLTKPSSGSGGAGIEVHDPARLDQAEALGEELCAGTWLVQQQVAPHPDMAELALDALPTVRMTTILDEQGEPEIVSAALRFPARRDVPVDNGHAGGLIAPVDIATGALGEGLSGWAPGRYPQHPLTAAQVVGRVLPDWDEARELAIRAHRSLYPSHVIIGWDMGIAEGGPVLVEANQRPAVRLTQRAAGRGIGDMRYGELINHHLREAIAKRPERRFRMLIRG